MVIFHCYVSSPEGFRGLHGVFMGSPEGSHLMVDFFMEDPWKIHDLVSPKHGLDTTRTTNKIKQIQLWGDVWR